MEESADATPAHSQCRARQRVASPRTKHDGLRGGTRRDIRVLWTLAGKRRAASAQQLQAALGPDYSLWDDFPEKPGEARGLHPYKFTLPIVGGVFVPVPCTTVV